ncbi:hypothetical protein ALQ86_200110 [Pseudomonas amygdali pv. eriobotryae]|uniref:Uncharacterized protein n=1 Tax=Pseudomonas amygdali pv. eriobotryae TaxID=129137 RepID=A0A3M3AD21_PSEA0|nr:hypothetical protein ALQ86_200110 [Pseudomonas amygdali pv. eriobotryae]
MHPQVFDATTLLQITGLELRRFLSTQAVVQQHGQYGPIAQPLECFSVWGIEQLLGLVVTEGRCLAFIALNPRPFDAVDGITSRDRVVLQKVIEQAGQRGQFSADGGPGQAALFQIGAPGQYVRPGDLAKIIGAG